jgi:hypothetical protein
VRLHSPAKLSGAVIVRKGGLPSPKTIKMHRVEANAIHLARELHDINVRQQ